MTIPRSHPFSRAPADAATSPWRDRLVCCVLLVLLVAARLFDVTPLHAVRLWGFDAVTALRPAASQAPSVVVVDIDDASLAELGQWPWPRSTLGQLVERLVDAGASVVVLDMLLAEADRMSPGSFGFAGQARLEAQSDNDAVLAAAMNAAPVVSGAAALATGASADSRDPMTSRIAVRGAPSLDDVPRLSGLIRPLAALENASRGIGLINLYPDIDGTVRTVPGVLVVDQTMLPGLAIEAVRTTAEASNLVLDAPSASGPDGIQVAGRIVPTDRRGRIWIDAGDPHRVPVVPAHQLLAGASAEGAVRGRVAIVGVSAAGIGRLVKTAAGIPLPSAEFQAAAIESILSARTMARPAILLNMELTAAVVIGLMLALASGRLGLPLLGIAALGLWVAVPAGATVITLATATIVDASFPLLVGLVIAGYLALARVREQSVVRRRQSEMLAQQGVYMRQVVDTSFDAIVTVDQEARILTANAGAERLFKRPVEAILGTRIDAQLAGFWASAVREDPVRALEDSVRGRQIIAAGVDRGSGIQVPIELSVAETMADDRVFVIVLRDISARIGAEDQARQAIERLRDAVERITDGFALFGPDRRLVICNTRFIDMLGEAGATARPGGRFDVIMECYARTSRAPVEAAGRADVWLADRMAALAGSAVPRAQECLDGRWFRIDERPTADGGLVGVYTDITELKNREIDITEAMLRAEAASSAKSEFLANMSHELRTPLNAVIGFADLMKQELFGPLGHQHYRTYVEDIIDSGSKLLGMIEVILDFARSERVSLMDPEAKSALNDVVGAVIRDLGPSAGRKRIEIATDLAPALPMLNVDASILYQIVQNLVSNGIKFSNAGAPIQIRTFMNGGGRIGLSVADRGVGVPDDLIDKVTQPFWQRQGPLVRDHDGVGLGLAIVSSHVNMLGGELMFDSRVGHGTTVTVLLPPSQAAGPS